MDRRKQALMLGALILIVLWLTAKSCVGDGYREPEQVKAVETRVETRVEVVPVTITFLSPGERQRWAGYAAAYVASGLADYEERHEKAADMADRLLLLERLRGDRLGP